MKYSEVRIDEEVEKFGEFVCEIVGVMRCYKNSYGFLFNVKFKYVVIYIIDFYEVFKIIEKDIVGIMNIEKFEIIKGEFEFEERIIEIKLNFKMVGLCYGKFVLKIIVYFKENVEEVVKVFKESGKIEFEVDG